MSQANLQANNNPSSGLPTTSHLATQSQCTCFTAALGVSSDLNAAIDSSSRVSLIDILDIITRANKAAETYSTCARCQDPSQLTLYVVIIQQSLAWIRKLLAPPKAGDFLRGHQGHENFVKIRIGNFETEAKLSPRLASILMDAEVQNLKNALLSLESMFAIDSIKLRHHSETPMLGYQKRMMRELLEEIRRLEEVVTRARDSSGCIIP